MKIHTEPSPLFLKLQSEGCYIPPLSPVEPSLLSEVKSTLQKTMASFCQFITQLFKQPQTMIVGRKEELVSYKITDTSGQTQWCWFICEAPIYGVKK